eukprot:1159529-Pelagomonas_calceolata.AAC.6
MVEETNLRLGLPAIVTHIIDPKSPLFDLSLEEMEVKALCVCVLYLHGVQPKRLYAVAGLDLKLYAMPKLPCVKFSRNKQRQHRSDLPEFRTQGITRDDKKDTYSPGSWLL